MKYLTQAQIEILNGSSKYANHIGWSDVTPYEVVRVVSSQTIEIREMATKMDPTWEPTIVPGGFSGHCTNSSEQRWVITPNYAAPVIRARLRKDGYFHSIYGKHVLAIAPRMFHDYNF